VAGTQKASATATWLDDRLGLAGLSKKYMRKVFPDHWSFMLGEIALWSFVVLLLTGVFLTLWFKPGMADTTYHGSYAQLRGLKVSEAYASTLKLSFDVRGGLLMRQTHHWAANIFIAAMFVHMIRVFVTGAFRRPREINWVIGATMLLLGVLEGFAGYSLPDDLLSGTGLRIAEGLIQSIPVIGTYVSLLVFGGQMPGDAIVSRLFIAHVLLIPGLLIALIGAHMLILVYQKHTQWPGPGRTNRNVVGFPMLPVYAAKSGGYFFMVFGVSAILGALITINPIWEFGPYEPAMATADSQPDWYMGLPEGLLRLMPGWDTVIWGHTFAWNVFIPGVLMPMVIFIVFVSFPFVASWASRDKREHHLLQRPRDVPNRTAFLLAMITLYGVLWLAGGDDVVAVIFHLDVNTLVELLRGAVFIAPVLAFIVTRRCCIALQRQDREQLLEGAETGVISRSVDGGYSEKHRRLGTDEVYTLTSGRQEPTVDRAPAPRSGRAKGGLRRRFEEVFAGDVVPTPTRSELEQAGDERDAQALSSADGHQYDGRRDVAERKLRNH
jgi:ubiquinol-cytochrome c reductase cytochrome b subunit